MTNTPQLPGYRIRKEIGSGGMATVFLAQEERSGRSVAVKWYVPTIFGENRGNRRFIKETRLMKQLKHPGIVSVYDAGMRDEYGYLVMEYLPKNLAEMIDRNDFIPVQKAVNLIVQVADALFYLHRNGIVHRDIKPGNILLRQDGTPALVDFGIAKLLDSETRLTKTGISVGTPLYMSPEQCQAKKVTGRSDLYSLGTVFFEMLTGQPPYTGRDTRTIMVKHINEPPPKLPFRLRTCQPLCDALMAKKPGDRPASMAALQKLAAAALGQEPHPTTRPVKKNEKRSQVKQRPGPTRKKSKRGRLKGWLLFLLILALSLWLAHLLGLIRLPVHPGLIEPAQIRDSQPGPKSEHMRNHRDFLNEI